MNPQSFETCYISYRKKIHLIKHVEKDFELFLFVSDIIRIFAALIQKSNHYGTQV